jgi:transcriptional antiterminator RfaH
MAGAEDRAELHLRRQGFQPFTPRQQRTVRHARRLVVKHVAFFPGYMFVPLDLTRDRWRSINGTIGVRSLVMQGGRPAPCPVGLVERLVELSDGKGLLDLSSKLRPGEGVQIVSGPFSDLIGTLERLDHAGRARVLINILNGLTAVTMDVKALIAAA